MTFEVLKIIAIICQLGIPTGTGASLETAYKYGASNQLNCQLYLYECYSRSTFKTADDLVGCIRKYHKKISSIKIKHSQKLDKKIDRVKR